MERIESINPDRIAWCCMERGVTPDELAIDVGISPTTMTRVMHGESGLTFNQLRKMAEYFHRGVLFFLEPGHVNEAQVHTPQFRTLTNQKPELSPRIRALIERVEKQRAVYLSLLEDLGDEIDRPSYMAPDLPRQDPRRAASLAREWLQVGEQNNFESYRAAVEKRGVLVFRSNGYSGKWQIPKNEPILGFSIYDDTCPVIVIKKQWEQRQSFTLMHELGHLLLHRTSSIDDEGDFESNVGSERDANAFAGLLLVPDEFLRTINDPERPQDVADYDAWLRPYRQAWGVSGEVILLRLLDSARLSRDQYDAYRHWREQQEYPESESGSRQYRHREPRHVFGDPFVRTVLAALNARQVTLAKASSYLDSLKIKDLHKLEQYYAGV